MSTQVNEKVSLPKENVIDVGNIINNIAGAKMEGKDKASTSSVSYIERDIEMTRNILARLHDKIELTSQQDMAECCIYRVPNSFRNVKPEAYTPQLISIGPLHRGDERLKGMEEQKWRYFKEFAERDGMDRMKIEDLVTCIQDKEAYIRACYSENFNEITSSDFIEMILLDAVFIIEFFQDSNDGKSPNLKPWMIFDILEDLMLLENQLPFFIIQEIYDEAGYAGQEAVRIPFVIHAAVHFGKYMFSQGVQNTDPNVEGSRHFTDLLRNLMLSGAIKRSYSLDPVRLKFSAVMLHKAGVKFQVTRDECLVNITFEKGVLKIPHLKVDHNFERRVRNVMAMEECLYEGEAYICSYIKFMDQLIDTAGDVGLLVENGIIFHWLGDDAAVSNMINNFCENIGDIKYTYFGHISQRLNDYFQRPYNNVIATLALVYFRSKWRATGTISGGIMLILTLIQTIKAFS